MRAAVTWFAALVVVTGAYACTQQPKLSLNPEQFGLMLLRGGYRSWFLSFSDGRAFMEDGKLHSVVVSPENGQFRLGYRIIPRYTHMDMRGMPKVFAPGSLPP